VFFLKCFLRRLFPGELKHTFEEAGGFGTFCDDVGTLNTRATDVPASFYAAVKPMAARRPVDAPGDADKERGALGVISN